MQFRFEHRFLAPLEVLFEYHKTPDNLSQLLGGWRTFRMVSNDRSIRVGSITRLQERIGFLWVSMSFEHFVYDPPRRFGERLIHGPFLKFEHIHEFELTASGTLLRDLLDVRLPWYWGGEWAMKHFVAPRLRDFFAYRHVAMEKLIRDGAINGVRS